MNNIKRDFPLLENENITYLDSGATTQKPIQVIKAVEEFYQKYNANPHRGAYSLSVEATEQYENTRTKIAKFINAKHREESATRSRSHIIRCVSRVKKEQPSI